MQLCVWLRLTMAMVRGSEDTRRVSSTVSSSMDTCAEDILVIIIIIIIIIMHSL